MLVEGTEEEIGKIHDVATLYRTIVKKGLDIPFSLSNESFIGRKII